jgi:hypothetical protein
MWPPADTRSNGSLPTGTTVFTRPVEASKRTIEAWATFVRAVATLVSLSPQPSVTLANAATANGGNSIARSHRHGSLVLNGVTASLRPHDAQARLIAAARRHVVVRGNDDAIFHVRVSIQKLVEDEGMQTVGSVHIPVATSQQRGSLRDLETIAPKLRELRARHVAYGAEPEHYPVVGAVLIASMAAIAGDAWTTEFEAAWNEAFEIVAATMLEGAEEAALQSAA